MPRIRAWLASMPTRPTALIEPFAGGGSVSVTVAVERLAEHVTLVERDPQVAAVWQTILTGDGLWLADRIATVACTAESVAAVLTATPATLEELAVQTLLRNRVNHGGILAPGAGQVRHGDHGKGVRSRWYPQTLARRIREIIAVRDRITLLADDGIAVLRRFAACPTAVFFLDPPYPTEQSRRRSTHADLDHEVLFSTASTLAGEVLMTYADTPLGHARAARSGLATHRIAMQTGQHARKTELLIGRRLDWAREEVGDPRAPGSASAGGP